MEAPKFPEDFHCFKHGVPVSDAEVQKWIDRCIDHLENNSRSDFYSIATGDTCVEVTRITDDECGSNPLYHYDIIVSKGYYQTRTW
jgi:hypothetical protein